MACRVVFLVAGLALIRSWMWSGLRKWWLVGGWIGVVFETMQLASVAVWVGEGR
jgi:hypothetical protein